jgi:DUF4097 and DUF4098 domain-containing protein YvlB
VQVEARGGGWPWRADFALAHDGPTLQLRGTTTVDESALATAVEWLLWPFQLLRVQVDVRVPRRFSVVVHSAGGNVTIAGLDGDASAQTSGGRVEVENITGSVDATTSGGRIEVAGVRGDVHAETSGGGIRVEEVSGSVEARSSGGGIDVRGAGGAVTAVTSNGRISASFSGPPAGDLETRGGRIEVRFPENAGADLDASTTGGRVEVDQHLTFAGEAQPHRVSGTVNGGGASLRVRTSGGGIRIEPS